MDEWMWRFLGKVPLDAINLTLGDLGFMEEILSGKSAIARPEQVPGKNFVSANLAWKEAGKACPWKPFLILEQKPRGFRKTWKIAVTGLAAEQGAYNRSMVELRDPAAALPEVLAKIREKCDYVILLTNLHAGAVEKLVQDHPGVDMAILANHGTSLNPPRKIGETALVESFDQGKFLGEIALYMNGAGQVERLRNRYIELNSSIPDPPELARMAQEAESQLDAVRMKR